MGGLPGPGGISPALSVPLTQAAPTLRPGQVLSSRVLAQGDGLALQIAGARVPVAADSGLSPGQRVQVEVQQTAHGLALRVTPQAATPVPSSTTGTAGLAAPLLAALAQLGATDAESMTAAQAVLPNQPPLPADAMRQLLSLFLARQDLGSALDNLARMAQQLAAAGFLEPGKAAGLTSLLAQLPGIDAERLRAWARRWSEQAARPIEARLALSDDTAPLSNDLRAQILALRDDPELAERLRAAGQFEEFSSRLSAVLDRLTGSHLQNLRGTELPYVFFEVPFPEQSPIRRALVHLLGGQGRGEPFDAENASLVLDLSTTHLGDLWVTLRAVRGHCQCTFRAGSEETVSRINEAAQTLSAALGEAGYARAEVRAVLWQGNRLEAISDLFAGLGGLDVGA